MTATDPKQTINVALSLEAMWHHITNEQAKGDLTDACTKYRRGSRSAFRYLLGYNRNTDIVVCASRSFQF
jgi:uncharacterized protein YbgA (DUF1722 family)